MTEQTTYVSETAVKADKKVLIEHRGVFTGSPQAIIYLHADFRDVTRGK